MRIFGSALAISLALAGAAAAKTTAADLAAPVHQFMDALGKGDMAVAAASYATGPVTIIDEVPPYIWTGADALKSWAGDLTKYNTAHGVTQDGVTLGDVKRVEVDGGKAYLVIAATYHFTQNGKAMTEPARMTYALTKAAGAWKISGWTWTGPKPMAAPPEKPKP